MGNKLTLILLTIFICSPVNIIFADQPLTNEQIVVNAISVSALSLIDSLGLEPSNVMIKPSAGIDELAIDGFKSALVQAGFVIGNWDTSTGAVGYSIDVSLSAFDFSYSSGKSHGFLKKKNVKRLVSGQLLVRMSGSDYNFIGFKNFEYSDEVDPLQLNYIASIRYNQLSPSAPGGGMMRYLEPLAVTATVGGLIYLFFVNR